MKQTMNQILCLVAFLGISSIPVFGKSFAVGPYLGQTPPGSTPQVFAPGLICDTRPRQWESHGHFSADGNTFCFNRLDYVYITENTDQGWTTPKHIGRAVCLRMPIVSTSCASPSDRYGTAPICPNAGVFVAACARPRDGLYRTN